MNDKVSLGPTTYASWSAAGSAFVGAIIVYLTGDHTAQTLTAVELAGASVLIFAISQLARYLQAHKKIGLASMAEALIPEIEAGEGALQEITTHTKANPPAEFTGNPPATPPVD